jgi:hypothetical protein
MSCSSFVLCMCLEVKGMIRILNFYPCKFATFCFAITVIIIIIIIIISFTRGIYTYIPETNHVPREYIVAAILSLLFMVPISLVPALALLHFYVSTFRSMRAVPNMAVFCSSLTPWFPGMLRIFWMILKWFQSLQLHWTTNFKKIVVSVMNMLLIYLFESMKLEERH